MPLLLDPHNYVRCLHCDRVFIPTYISPTTATVRCPSCNTSSRLPTTRPPSPPPPTPTNIEDEDFDEDIESISDEDEAEFDTIIFDWTAETNEYEHSPTPAATSFLNSLNCEKCAVTDNVLKQAPSCAICTDEFKLEESVNLMPCDHWFHYDCIVTWLKRKNNCPLCRHEFPREPDQDHMLRLPVPENPTASTRLGNSSQVPWSFVVYLNMDR